MNRFRIYFFLLGVLLFPSVLNGQWYLTGNLVGGECTYSGSTFVDSGTTIKPPKMQGAYVFCAREIAYFNPFSGSIIATCQGPACVGTYYVNNYPFIYNYALYQYRNPDGSPNQSVAYQSIKKSQVYYFDTEKPICERIEFDKPYFGGWTNQELFVRGICKDGYSGCDADSQYSTWKTVTHGMESFDTTFRDNAGNVGTVSCNVVFPTGELPKVDRADPDITIEDITTEPVKLLYDLASETDIQPWYFFADPREFRIFLHDPVTENYKASGIRDWSIAIRFTGDQKGTVAPREIGCSKSESYGEYTTSTLEDRKTPIVLRCDELKKVGNYIFHIQVRDWAGNEVILEREMFIVPNRELIPRFVQEGYYQEKNRPGTYIQDNQTKIFANATDYYRFIFSLFDKYNNPIYSKPIMSFKYTGKLPLLDDYGATGENGFDITNRILPALDTIGNMGDMIFKSYIGSEVEQSFEVTLPQWNEKYEDVGTQVVAFGTGLGVPFSPLFFTEGKFGGEDTAVVLGQQQSIDLETFMNYRGSGSTKLYPYIPGVGIGAGTSINYIDALFAIPEGVFHFSDTQYSGTSSPASEGYIPLMNMNYAAGDYTAVLASGSIAFTGEQLKTTDSTLGIRIQPVIRHILNGKSIRYAMDDVIIDGGKLNSIYIVGLQQSEGKEEFVTKNLSIGAVTWSTLINQVRSNVGTMTRGRTPNDGLDTQGIRYITGDYTLSAGDPSWETLVVIDGNVTIGGGAFNTKKRNIGIILLNEKNPRKGNVFIKPDVPFVAATIVAEGSIQSVNPTGLPYTVSNRTRTKTLEKQLVFYGNLASKNTIGGAILGKLGAQYVLADGEETSDFVQAMNQDLSFLRMQGKGFDDPNWTQPYNEGRDESVVVVSNTDTIQDPPVILDRVIR